MPKKYQIIYADPEDRITCRVCGKDFRFLGSHIRYHNLTEMQYKDKFEILHLLPLCSEEMSLKISRKNKAHIASGRIRLDEARAKINKSNITHPTPIQTREAHRRIHLGIPLAESTKKKLALAKIGTKQSAETKLKIGLAMRGNTHTLGHHLSDEHKAKLSVLYWARCKEAKLKDG